MNVTELGEVQLRFAELVWANAPVSSGALVKLCEKELGWKKSTTYTVLRKLCDKGLFENENGTVKAKLTREQYDAAKSGELVNGRFGGSLPAFIAAFVSANPISGRDADEIRAIIDAYKKETGQ